MNIRIIIIYGLLLLLLLVFWHIKKTNKQGDDPLTPSNAAFLQELARESFVNTRTVPGENIWLIEYERKLMTLVSSCRRELSAEDGTATVAAGRLEGKDDKVRTDRSQARSPAHVVQERQAGDCHPHPGNFLNEDTFSAIWC